jgi:hypothetical protein
VRVAAPDDAPESLASIAERNPDERLWNARALGAMRRRMAADIGAAVVIGGRVRGQQGFFPGVIEEAVCALSAGVPLFVAGGFGGCGRLIARVLDGERPPELSLDYQRSHGDYYAELLAAASRADALPDYGSIIASLSARGVGGLGNGLDEGENRRLLATDDVDELIALVLHGLFRIAANDTR